MEQKEINKLHLIRLGKILNNFIILGFVYMLLTALMPLLTFLAFIVVGLIFILMLLPWILSAFTLDIGSITQMFNQEVFSQLHGYMYTALPYVFGVSAAFAVISVVIFAFDKSDKHVGRIVIAALALVVGIIAMIMRAKGVMV